MKLITVDEYQDPSIYEAEYGGYTDDFKIFLGQKSSGHALDLACGTGRLTIALAQSGLNCMGMDENPNMLLFARKKSGDLPIKFLEGDMRDFALNQKFDLITMAGNSFQALLTTNDQKSCLSCVRKHLTSDGIFAFNTRNPQYKDYRTTTKFEHWHDFIDTSGTRFIVSGKQRYDEKTGNLTYSTKRTSPVHETISQITLRFTKIDELRELLSNCGFCIHKMFGDAFKNPFNEQSSSIYVLCGPRD